MDIREDFRDFMELYCGRAGSFSLAQEKRQFPLPGDESHWPRDRVFDLRHVKLELALDVENKRIGGTAHHTFALINDRRGCRGIRRGGASHRICESLRRNSTRLQARR